MFDEEVARNSGVTRVVAVVLTEAEWRALRAVEPTPAAWLQQLVKERLREAPQGGGSNARPYEPIDGPGPAASARLAG